MIHKRMAALCHHCPLCKYARANPRTIPGRLLHWHGKWCPVWKAWEEIYGKTRTQ